MVDPQSFGLCMLVLRSLPNSVWWLPAYGRPARQNLMASARQAGVDPARLVFMQACSRAQLLSRIRLADLFVDMLRFNANHGLADALRMGLPGVSCAGNSMASRLGGSILRSAGLADCVADSPDAYLGLLLRLGNDPGARAALRQRLVDAAGTAPLFDAPARVREWEWAWAHMVQQRAAGAASAAFDVPDQSMPHAAAQFNR